MTIAVYKDNLSTGRGADSAVKNFAVALRGRGHDVSLMEKDEFFTRVLRYAGNVFDVIVATGSNEIVDMEKAGYFARHSRAKVVLQLHLAPCGFFKWKHPLRNRRIRAAFDMPDAVQVLCSSYEKEFRRIAPHPSIFTIGNYAPFDCYPSIVAHRFPTILYPAATINRIKNQKLLIEAFSLLATEFPEWKVRILGKDTTSYASACRRLVARKELCGRIEFIGFTRDLYSEYSKASFIAFPSTLEGFPLAILESAQFGLPVVVQSCLPGVSDIVHDGETGLVTSCSTTSYAEGLRRLMAAPELCRRMGAQARKFCLEHYSREKILDKWEELLKSVVRRNAVLIQ